MLTHVIGRIREYVNVLSDLEILERNAEYAAKHPDGFRSRRILWSVYHCQCLEPFRAYIKEHPLDAIRTELENELNAAEERIHAIIDASEGMSPEDPECRRVLMNIVLIHEWYDRFDDRETFNHKIYLGDKVSKGPITEHVEEIDAFLSAHPVSGNAL